MRFVLILVLVAATLLSSATSAGAEINDECSDYATQEDAQSTLDLILEEEGIHDSLAATGADVDALILALDADGDGIACEADELSTSAQASPSDPWTIITPTYRLTLTAATIVDQAEDPVFLPALNDGRVWLVVTYGLQNVSDGDIEVKSESITLLSGGDEIRQAGSETRDAASALDLVAPATDLESGEEVEAIQIYKVVPNAADYTLKVWSHGEWSLDLRPMLEAADSQVTAINPAPEEASSSIPDESSSQDEDSAANVCVQLDTTGGIGFANPPSACDNGEGDENPAVGVIEFRDIPSGAYRLEVVSGADGMEPREITVSPDGPTQIVIGEVEVVITESETQPAIASDAAPSAESPPHNGPCRGSATSVLGTLDGLLGGTLASFSEEYGEPVSDDFFYEYEIDGCGSVLVSDFEESIVVSIGVFAPREDEEKDYFEPDEADWTIEEAMAIAESFLPEDAVFNAPSGDMTAPAPGMLADTIIVTGRSDLLAQGVPPAAYDYVDNTPAYGGFSYALFRTYDGGVSWIDIQLGVED